VVSDCRDSNSASWSDWTDILHYCDINVKQHRRQSELPGEEHFSMKADHAEALLRKGGIISMQVLNEVTNVARRKLAISWTEINEIVELIKSVCPVEPLTLETHDRGRLVAERYGLGLYDAMVVAAALLSGCEILYSDDIQNGLLRDQQLGIRNPFTAGKMSKW
jgi:predicted nucleic acid-binding protein